MLPDEHCDPEFGVLQTEPQNLNYQVKVIFCLPFVSGFGFQEKKLLLENTFVFSLFFYGKNKQAVERFFCTNIFSKYFRSLQTGFTENIKYSTLFTAKSVVNS